MSTQYITKPRIKYEDFIKIKSIKIEEPPKNFMVNENMLLSNNGSYLYVFKGDSGDTEFVRYGINKIENIFPSIIEEFGVEIYDEYGLKYPDCIR